MTTTSTTAPPATRCADLPVPVDLHSLAGEHALLMRDVQRRAAPVLALLAARTWPHAELGALVAYLRSAVLRQASDEETALFPHDASGPPFAELSAEHVRLHALTARLDLAHRRPCSRSELRGLVEQLLLALRRHLSAEQAVLAALPHVDAVVPGAADVVAGAQAWAPDDRTPVVVDLDALPESQAVELCVERVLRLNAGQTAEVRAEDELLLRRVCRWIHAFDAERFGVEGCSDGSAHVRRITRRRGNVPAGIGYPG